MVRGTRRAFFGQVGKGMLLAGVGALALEELGVAPALGLLDEGDPVQFGELEPLVALMQETPESELPARLLGELKQGRNLSTLVAAGAMANARTFGGTDYTGYHAFMALAPALEMSALLPEERRALPVIKVLVRNTHRIRQVGGRRREALKVVAAGDMPSGPARAALQASLEARDVPRGEKTLLALIDHDAGQAYDALQVIVRDDPDVHRIVLAWRAWDMLRLTGHEYAGTMLRQTVRFCVDHERRRLEHGRAEPRLRRLIPALVTEHRLDREPKRSRAADDRWVAALSETIGGPADGAAEAVAAAIAEGFPLDAVAEAIALAANRLLLLDPGRKKPASMGRGKGSVHGASIGVHACDAANAWRQVSCVTSRREAAASLVAGAWHTAANRLGRRHFDYSAELDAARKIAPEALLDELDEAVRANDQKRACALAQGYGEREQSPVALRDRLLRYAVSEDGALHAEKYFATAWDEFNRARPAFRWRHLIALARVSASEYGRRAPGYAQACRLLKVPERV